MTTGATMSCGFPAPTDKRAIPLHLAENIQIRPLPHAPCPPTGHPADGLPPETREGGRVGKCHAPANAPIEQVGAARARLFVASL